MLISAVTIVHFDLQFLKIFNIMIMLLVNQSSLHFT